MQSGKNLPVFQRNVLPSNQQAQHITEVVSTTVLKCTLLSQADSSNRFCKKFHYEIILILDLQ
jgi:hypothetical protein